MATVLIPTAMRALSTGRDRVTVSGSTLRQVIEDLETQCPGAAEWLLDNGVIRDELSIAVNGEVTHAGLTQSVPPDAEIFIVPAIAGGC